MLCEIFVKIHRVKWHPQLQNCQLYRQQLQDINKKSNNKRIGTVKEKYIKSLQ